MGKKQKAGPTSPAFMAFVSDETLPQPPRSAGCVVYRCRSVNRRCSQHGALHAFIPGACIEHITVV
jgi:hypothetical protein